MTKEQTIEIAAKVFPNEITWDALEALCSDPDILERAIMAIKDAPLFSELQEEKLMVFFMECWEAGHINIKGLSAYFHYVNWTDIIYALIKTQHHLFNPESHV